MRFFSSAIFSSLEFSSGKNPPGCQAVDDRAAALEKIQGVSSALGKILALPRAFHIVLEHRLIVVVRIDLDLIARLDR